MKLGMSTACFFNKASTESSFDYLRQLKVDNTEVFLNTYSEYEKPFIDNIVPRKGNINVHSVHALGNQFEPELFNPNSRVRNDAEILFRKVCYATLALGAKYYTFHGPLMLRANSMPDFDKFSERFNQLADIAASYGVKISYENVHYSYFYDLEFFEKMSEACPKFLCTFDVKQALFADEDPIKMLNAMASKITTIHVCDVLKGKTCLPGQGKLDFERLFKEIKKRDIDAPILMEVYSTDYTDISELKDSFSYLSGIVQKLDK